MFETGVRKMRARTGGTYVLFIKCAYLRGGYVRTSKNRQKVRARFVNDPLLQLYILQTLLFNSEDVQTSHINS